jgi:hypothetical protein
MADELKNMPDLATYTDLEAATPWSKRTIQTMMRKGEFPEPLRNVPGPHRQWHKQDILDYIESQRAGALAKAAKQPAKIRDADVETALLALASRHSGVHRNRIVGVSYVPDAGERQQIAASANQRLEAIKGAFLDNMAAMPPVAALCVVAAVFPQLRSYAVDSLAAHGIGVTMPESDWRATAMQIIEEALP